MRTLHSPITLGEKTLSRKAGPYILTATSHAADRFLPRHSHENANIALVRRGDFVESIGSRRWDCRAGSTILKPAGAEHSNRYGGAGMDCVVVEMLPGSNPDVHFREPDVFEDVRMVHLAAMLRYEMDADDVAAPLVLEGVVLQIVANAIRVQSPRERAVPRWLDDMRGALHERSAETLRIGDVARGLGIHPTHAVREFRRRFGLTPGEYLRRVRVERAAALLRDGMSLADAAVNAGFAHPSHFSRTFKRYWHMTPQQWLSAARR